MPSESDEHVGSTWGWAGSSIGVSASEEAEDWDGIGDSVGDTSGDSIGHHRAPRGESTPSVGGGISMADTLGMLCVVGIGLEFSGKGGWAGAADVGSGAGPGALVCCKSVDDIDGSSGPGFTSPVSPPPRDGWGTSSGSLEWWSVHLKLFEVARGVCAENACSGRAASAPVCSIRSLSKSVV